MPEPAPIGRSRGQVNAGRRRVASGLVGAAAGVIVLAAAQSERPASASPPQAACPSDAVVVEAGASLQDAVDRSPPGTSFCLRSGIHRLQSVVPKARQGFYGEAGSVLDGSRVLTDFVRQGDRWVAEATTQAAIERGACLPVSLPCRRPAGLFVDGARLRQVSRREDVTEGAFFLDRAAERLYLGTDPTNRRVEVSVSRYAFVGEAPDVSFHGLTVQKYDNPAQEGAIHGKAARGWRIEDCELRLNNGAGAGLGPDGIVRRSNVHHNGQLGIAGTGDRILIEANEIWANNTLGFDPGWDAGGVKLTVGSGAVMRGNRVHHNNGPGLWCDIDCRDTLFVDNEVDDNEDAGIFFEISSGARILGNTVRRNGLRRPGWVWGAQIQIAGSDRVLVTGNEVEVPPFGQGIMLVDQGRPRASGGLYKTRGNVVQGNTVRFDGSGRSGGTSDRAPGSENAGIIEKGGNLFDRNTYLVRATQPARFLWGYDEMTYADFQSRGQETNGRWMTR